MYVFRVDGVNGTVVCHYWNSSFSSKKSDFSFNYKAFICKLNNKKNNTNKFTVNGNHYGHYLVHLIISTVKTVKNTQHLRKTNESEYSLTLKDLLELVIYWRSSTSVGENRTGYWRVL